MQSQSELEACMQNFFRDFESMWGIDATNSFLVPSISTEDDSIHWTVSTAPPPSPIEEPRYIAPQSTQALQIWEECGFRKPCGERRSTIEYGLEDWATRKKLLCIGKDDSSWISWNGISGRWSAFVLWFLHSCTKVDPPK